jgi:hypothetical protein
VSSPERQSPERRSPERRSPERRFLEGRYGQRAAGRWVGALALVFLALVTLNTILTTPNGAGGIAPGKPLAPFAVPLATSDLTGDANIATRAEDGEAGARPACSVRGPRILNICQLYEAGPVVLALFVDAGSCAAVLDELQALVPAFPQVRFAAVSIKGERRGLRALVRTHRLSFPLGIDEGGTLVALYKVASCPQVTFALPGGVVQSKALLSRPTPATLRARVQELLAAARAQGWRPR